MRPRPAKPGPGQESVWDYPRPPALETCSSSIEIWLGGEPLGGADDEARTAARGRHLGFVFQFHYLLLEFTALENVVIPQLINGLNRQEAVERSAQILGFLGLGERLTHRPSELSGGEQQRVAIARAMSNRPRLLLADEPTSNLDDVRCVQVLDLLLDQAKGCGATLVIATHDQRIKSRVANHYELTAVNEPRAVA